MRSPALLAAALAMVALLAAGARAAAAAADEAYVTLLYGDEFVLGVRVLGKSIRDTGTHRDMVVLVSDGVSEYSRKLFQADGWIVKRITLLANPNQVRPKRFWGVYTKLKIFNMTSYKKVVYLDADTVVVKSIEDLFKCGKFCGNLKHSERMNSGVMVVEPSESLFNDMISQVGRLPSYTGGDQGFLNSYYSDFANSHVYEPDSPLTPEPETQRLSTLYNADVGLYMLANKWMVDEKELRVIHYTLGPLKPWDWWTVWLVKPVEIWQFSNGTHSKLPSYFGAISVLVCFISAGFSLAFAFAIIPRQVMPWTGLLLMFEWTFVAFFLIFGSYLRFVYRWGSISANHAGFSNSDSSENHMVSGHQRNMSDCDMDATFYWIGMAAIATVTVLLPTILGITALFTKLGLMVAGGVVLASFMTYASEHLAISAFHKGQKNRNTSRTRSFCFLC
ncbi:inositol phosphorylceramide glucuronosyltransferase 1-like isoform X2 [Phragmites australis]|uniref:inositol phosphorylceramide glucuronosyltransferase 1-like isoform X2 n=1 Tax=Phragmites australis TaxID=29695 RepID=UPI002D769595|nr:inositol phosphorylceramide glucuronosyltransferase 1-like isoform X2 [Phragmites australis]